MNKVFPSKKESCRCSSLASTNGLAPMAFPPWRRRPSVVVVSTCWSHQQPHYQKNSLEPSRAHFKEPSFIVKTNLPPRSDLLPVPSSRGDDQTFTDKNVFESVSDTADTFVNSIVQSLGICFGRSYPWAIGRGRNPPAGYILAKTKTNYKSGRPIISFVDTPFRPMKTFWQS